MKENSAADRFLIVGSVAAACADLLQELDNAKPGQRVAIVLKLGNLGRGALRVILPGIFRFIQGGCPSFRVSS